MIKKMLIVVAAMAMSIGTAAAVGVVGSGVAGAAAPPTTTINCTQTGAVNFASPGLSAGGALSANTIAKTVATVTGTGTGCSTTPINVKIVSATTPCPQTAGVPNPGDPAACLVSKTNAKTHVVTYAIAKKPNYYDTDGSFASSGLADLQAALQAKPLKTTVDNIPVLLPYGTATEVVPGGKCGATNVGFDISGNATLKGLTVGTYEDVVCITSDTGAGTTGNFLTDLGSPTAVIQSATLGAPSSLVVVLPNANCTVAGAVNFASPGLSAGGALSANTTVKTVSSTTASGANCPIAPINVAIPSATTPCPQTAGVPNPGDPAACLASKTNAKTHVVTYAIAKKPNYYDTDGSFATTGLADLQAALQAKPLKSTIDNIPVVLPYGNATEVVPGGACGATDVGFDITGNAQLKGLTIGTYEDIVCISSDSGPGTTGNFLTDLGSPTAVIQSATIGGASSLTGLLGPVPETPQPPPNQPA